MFLSRREGIRRLVFGKNGRGAGSTKKLAWKLSESVGSTKIVAWRLPGGAGYTKIMGWRMLGRRTKFVFEPGRGISKGGF